MGAERSCAKKIKHSRCFLNRISEYSNSRLQLVCIKRILLCNAFVTTPHAGAPSMETCDLDDVDLEAYARHPSVLSLYTRLERMQRLPMVNGRAVPLEHLLASPEQFDEAVASLTDLLRGALSPEMRHAIGLTRGRVILFSVNRMRLINPEPLRQAQQDAVIALEKAGGLLRDVIQEEIQRAGGVSALLRDLSAQRFSEPEPRREAETLARLSHDNALLSEASAKARTPEVTIALREMLERGQLEQRKLEEKLSRYLLTATNPRVGLAAQQNAAAKAAYERCRARLSQVTQAEKLADILTALHDRCRRERRLDIFASIFSNPSEVVHSFLNLPVTMLGKVVGQSELLGRIFTDPVMAEKLFANPMIPNLIFSRDMSLVNKFFSRERTEVLSFFEKVNEKGVSTPGLIGEHFKTLYSS